MNIVVCYKVVPEEQDIIVNSDRTLSFERAEWKIGDYDLVAVEAGRKVVQEVGGKLSALSIGDQHLNNSKLMKSALSRGPEELYLVIDETLKHCDAYQTAAVLAAALKKIGFDLVICGEGSSDLYAQQVGAQLGEQLGVNVVNAVSKIIPQENYSVIIERALEDEVEVLEVMLPAVLAVSSDICLPYIPQMKDILAAGKKPVNKWTLADLECQANSVTQIISTMAPENVDRSRIIYEGDSDDNIDAVVQQIRKIL